MKILTLTYPHVPLDNPKKEYRVVQIEQSVEFQPGQYMTEVEVKDLCDLPKMWKVIIKLNKT